MSAISLRRSFLSVFLALGVLGVLTATSLMAESPELVFFHQELGSRLTSAEYEKLEQECRAAFPGALDEVESFIGDSKVRKIFSKLKVAIYSQSARNGWIGMSMSSSRPTSRRTTPAITLFGEAFLAGHFDVKTVMTHEMIHALFEVTNDFDNLRSFPSNLSEGLAYFGSGEVHLAVIRALNRQTPRLNVNNIMFKRDRLKYYRERTLIYCFQQVYGEAARKKLVTSLFNGKKWETAIESAAGEEWAKVQEKCDACLRNYLAGLMASAGPLHQIEAAVGKKDYATVVELAKKYLVDEPYSNWRVSTTWRLAEAYEQLNQLDQALAAYESIRSGACGESVIYEESAERIVFCLLAAHRCDEAQAKRAEYERVYRLFWGETRDKLNKAFAEKCPAAS